MFGYLTCYTLVCKQNLHVLQKMGSQVTQCNRKVFDNSDIVVLAVKPNMVRRILREVYPNVSKDHLVISLAAGISIDTLQQVSDVLQSTCIPDDL